MAVSKPAQQIYNNGNNAQATNNPPSNTTTPMANQQQRALTQGLKSLQNAEDMRLLDVIDQIRSLGIKELELPQLVVCGSQSSGKSSVLEAISGYPFPRAEMTCTRFVTEISFRRSDVEGVTVSISADKSRPPGEIAQLENDRFTSVNSDPRQLPLLIKEAEKKLGLAGNRAFSRDVLRVQITGPSQRPLTLVDLPGMIESDSKNRENIGLIKAIVDDWISQKASIILAVVEAKNDAQTQGILTKAKEVDPTGERTFGIITKPDLAGRGSKLERFWVEHAMNSRTQKIEFPFRKGWHVVRNRNFQEMDNQTSSEHRDEMERRFFQNPEESWHTVDPQYWGIDSLRKRLRTLLQEHTRRQLPKLRREINAYLDQYQEELRTLESRLQQPDKLWSEFQDQCKEMVLVAKTGVDGKMNHPLFTDYDGEQSFYLRARIEEENDNFAEEMVSNGHGIRFEGVDDGNSPSYEDQLIEEVHRVLKITRGEELPGHFDPQRLDPLFWKHSKPWHGIAVDHVENTHAHCLNFLENIVETHLSNTIPGLPKNVGAHMSMHLRKALRDQKDAARAELHNLESDRLRSTKTRNKQFQQKTQKNRSEKLFRLVMRAQHQSDGRTSATMDLIDKDTKTSPLITPAFMSKAVGGSRTNSNEEDLAFDMVSYYQVARDVWTDNVIVQVIERHLLADLHKLFYSDFGLSKNVFLDLVLNDEEGESNHASMLKEKDNLETQIKGLTLAMEKML